MMSAPDLGSPVEILAVLPRDPVTEHVRRILEEEGMRVTVRDPADARAAIGEHRLARAVLVDEAMDPALVEEALHCGEIPDTAPVFVLARRLPVRERYLLWLERGAWDILKIPLEGVALALRLRNILERPPRRVPVRHRYPRGALIRVADETLALNRRGEGSLSCVAVAVVTGDTPDPSDTLLERLGDVSHELVRGSDLIGVSDGLLFILLPHTDVEGAELFVDRVRSFLQDRLHRWGLHGAIRATVVTADSETSGSELLAAAAQAL